METSPVRVSRRKHGTLASIATPTLRTTFQNAMIDLEHLHRAIANIDEALEERILLFGKNRRHAFRDNLWVQTHELEQMQDALQHYLDLREKTGSLLHVLGLAEGITNEAIQEVKTREEVIGGR